MRYCSRGSGSGGNALVVEGRCGTGTTRLLVVFGFTQREFETRLARVGLAPAVFAAAEVAFVFWFAYETRWRGFNRFGDYTYGIYLWGYPAQQMLAALAGGTHNYVNALGGLLIALALAVASWHLVEQQALRLKKLPNDIRKRCQAGQSGAVNRSGADKSGQELTSVDLQPAPAASAPASR